MIGSTGVWVIQSWEQGQRPRRHTTTSPWTARGVTADPLPKLRWQAAVFADMLAGERLLPSGRCCASPAAGWQAASR